MLLSICIPTCKRPEVLHKLLDSIYSQSCDESEFNICITDNSDSNETKEMLDSYFGNKKNLKYKKTSCEGFMNSIEALKLGDGELLKLHNDYAIFNDNSLDALINNIKKNYNNYPLIFFNNKDNKSASFDSFDEFIANVGIWTSWSSAFSIWKKDFDKIIGKINDINPQFPHSTLLFNQHKKNKYIVDNYIYTHNIDVKYKRPRNVTEHFCQIFYGMLFDLYLNNYISNNTLIKLKFDLVKFCGRFKVNAYFNKENYLKFNGSNKIIYRNMGFKGVAIYNIELIKTFIYRLYKKVF